MLANMDKALGPGVTSSLARRTGIDSQIIGRHQQGDPAIMALKNQTALTKRLLTGVATTALTLGLAASASAQNSNLTPTFGTEVYAQGFISSNLTIQAGGDIDASTFAPTCNGFIADAPDLIVDYSGQLGLQIEAASLDDTTIVVEMPDGAIICNDDFDGLNPGVQMASGEPGLYAVWVGTFEPIQNNTYPDADVFISEIATQTAPPPPPPSAGLDPFATPAFGTIAVSEGSGTQSLDMQAGGEVDAFAFDSRCAGYVAAAPDYVISYQGQGTTPLDISADSGDDTTLLVIDPNGGVFCNDDANGSLNPALSISNPVAGEYAVWVGTFNNTGDTFPDAILTVSSTGQTPTPPPPPSQGFNGNQAPTFGLVEVSPGFGVQTFDLQAGGGIDAFAVDPGCAGYVADAPDYVLEFRGDGRMPLDLTVNSTEDTTLVVVDPNGAVFCNDDDFDLNPGLYLNNPVSGDYAVWVGTFSPIQNDFYPEAQLTIATEAGTSTPSPNNGSFDVFAAPTFGRVDLGSDLSAGHAITLQAGGFTDAFTVNQTCNGWVADVPDYVIGYAGSRTPMHIAAQSDADTTLVVITPDGQVLCNDDDIDLNPGITINNPGPGDYTVYVGTYLPIENDFYPDALLTVSGEQSGRPLVPTSPGNFNQRALQTPTFGSVNLANGFASHAVELQAGGGLEGFEFGEGCNGYVADAPDYIINYGGGSDLQITATSDEDTTMTVVTPSGAVLCNDDFGDLNPGMFINDASAGSYAVWVGTYLPIENDFFPNATLRVAEVSADKTQPSGAITSTSLTAGFTPDPFTTVLAAGGPIDAGTVDGMCNGFIATEPDFELSYTSGSWPLRIYVQSDADTTLLMRTPTGEVMCNDDFDGLNPSLALSNPVSGNYEVFIGTYDPTAGNPNATLAVTELVDQKDLPPNAVLEASVFAGLQRQDFELLAGGSFQAFDTLDQSCSGYVAIQPDFFAYVEDAGVDIEMTVRSAEDTTLVVRTPSGQFICDDDAGGDFNPLVMLEGAQVGAYEIWLGTFSSVGHAPATLSIRDMNAGSTTPPNVPGGGKK